MDQSEPMDVSPVRPSVPRDHLEPQNRIELTLRQLDATLGALYQQTRRLESLGVDDAWTLDAFRTEMGPRVEMKREGNRYNLKPRPNETKPGKAGS